MSNDVNKSDQQKIFDRVATHLLTQNQKSTRAFGESLRCVYRGDYGCKCAVGCLIDDEHYDPSLEGESITSPRVSRAVELSLGILINYKNKNLNLLRALQTIHDLDEPSNWAQQLAQLAKNYGLTFTQNVDSTS